MQPVTAFIDDAKTGHDATDFKSAVICFNGQFIHNLRKLGQLQIGRHFISDEQNSFLC